MIQKSSHPRSSGEPRAPSQRQLRAGELIRQAVTEIIQREELRNPTLDGVKITISEVRASRDLRRATLYCLGLGGSLEEDVDIQNRLIAALNEEAAFIRGHLGRRLTMKFTPALKFVLDESHNAARRIDGLLADPRVRRDL